MKRFIEKTTLAAVFGLSVGLVLLLGGRCSDQIAYAQVANAQVENIIKLETLMTPAEFSKCGLLKLSTSELKNLNQWVEDWTVEVIKSSGPPSAGIKSLPSTKPVPGPDARLSTLQAYEGASIIAQDGTFLGILSKNKYDAKSLANKYGDYGSKYNSKSILNKYGQYGSEYSQLSPFNHYTSKPPEIHLNGRIVAYLTANKVISPRVDPMLLLAWLEIER